MNISDNPWVKCSWPYNLIDSNLIPTDFMTTIRRSTIIITIIKREMGNKKKKTPYTTWQMIDRVYMTLHGLDKTCKKLLITNYHNRLDFEYIYIYICDIEECFKVMLKVSHEKANIPPKFRKSTLSKFTAHTSEWPNQVIYMYKHLITCFSMKYIQ